MEIKQIFRREIASNYRRYSVKNADNCWRSRTSGIGRRPPLAVCGCVVAVPRPEVGGQRRRSSDVVISVRHGAVVIAEFVPQRARLAVDGPRRRHRTV